MVNRIAVIPARSGSKRIPKKNIIPFGGRPMISWTIEAALESDLFSKVLVSTDDTEIADVAEKHGAEVPFLRTENADDYSPVSNATIHAVKQAEAHWGTSFGTTVQLMANCPMRTAKDIERAVNAFDGFGRTFQISAFEFGWMNPWWAMRLNGDGTPNWLFPEARSQRSQDLEALFCPTGAIWIAKTDDLLRAGTFYGPGHSFEPMGWEPAMDIDDYADLRMAEALMYIAREQV